MAPTTIPAIAPPLSPRLCPTVAAALEVAEEEGEEVDEVNRVGIVDVATIGSTTPAQRVSVSE